MRHRLLIVLLTMLAANVHTATCQEDIIILPSAEQMYGKGIRKVVRIQGDYKHTTKIARDGSLTNPNWPKFKPDSTLTRRNRETLTDSIFWIRRGEAELTDVLFYRDSTFSELIKHIRGCRKGVLQQTSINLSTSDTTIWITIDGTDEYKPKPYFHIYKKYEGGEVNVDYDPDSIPINTRRIVYDRRGMVDTIYRWRRYGPPTGCFSPKKEERKEWQQIETHQYKYNRRGGITEESIYYDGELSYTIRYRLKYRLF